MNLFNRTLVQICLFIGLSHALWSKNEPTAPCPALVPASYERPHFANLQLEVSTPSVSYNLCNFTDYHVVTIKNASAEAAFGLHLQVDLPEGMDMMPETYQLAYPIGSSWVNITAPMVINGVFDWNIPNISTAINQNGLPGDNSISIRFKTIIRCGFISGSRASYRAFLQDAAGNIDGEISKDGAAVLLTNIPVPNEMEVSMTSDAPLPLSCKDTLPLKITLTGSQPTGNKDSLLVYLPIGASFVPNSYTAGSNAPTTQPSVQTTGGQQVLKWKLTAGVPSAATSLFSLKITGLGQQNCGIEGGIKARTIGVQTAVCELTGAACAISSTTGQAEFLPNVANPKFEFMDFDVDFDVGIAAYKVKLKNSGNQLHIAPTTYKFYRDNDQSGTLTAGDVLKYEHTIYFPIAPGDVIDLAGGLPVDLADICHLIVVLDDANLCLCAPVSLPVDQISRHIPYKSVCSGQYIDLGVLPVAGHQYLWTPSDALTCDTCAFPQFNFENASGYPMVFDYTFQESSGDCMVISPVKATVLPMPSILNSDTATCLGQPILLVTTDAVSHQWYGSGITDPTLPTQLVTPIATSTYFVNIKDSLGCFAIDTVTITINPTAWAEIGPDTLGVCGNTDLQFNAFFNPDFSYQWSPATAVSNANVHNPYFTATNTVTLVLTTTIPGGCSDRDTVFVGFSENPDISINTSSLSTCAGDTAYVQLAGGQQYFWAPSSGLTCKTPVCDVVAVVPEASTLYSIVGYNSYGCKDTVTLQVNVPGAVVKTSEQKTSCSDEPLLVFDQLVSTSGTYCRTYTGINGCDSTHCIEVKILQNIFEEINIALCEGETRTIGGIVYDKEGEFCQTYQVANGCDSTVCILVNVTEKPQLDSLYTVSVEEGTSSQALGLPQGLGQYQWSGRTDLLTCGNCHNPVANNLEDLKGNLTYTVLVSNGAGCTQSSTYILYFTPPCNAENVLMPNAFTPDGDGVNDVFGVDFHRGKEVFGEMQVYTRLGERIFITQNPSVEGWKGTNTQGQAVPADVYLYMVEIGCEGAPKVMKKGDITVIR